MNNNDNGVPNIDYILARIKNGFINILKPSKATAVLIVAIIVYLIYVKKSLAQMRYSNLNFAIESTKVSFIIGLFLLIIVGAYMMGAPPASLMINRRMSRIGIKNKKGETPMLLGIRKDDSGIKDMLFFAQGIPLSDWADHRASLEAALNMEVGSVVPASGKWLVRVKAVDAENGLPKKITWDMDMVWRDDFVLELGMSVVGHVTIDFNLIPHILIGGSTGSGKSVLLKCLLAQCIRKGAEVKILDLKGGADYGVFFKSKCEFVTTMEEAIETLDAVVKELQRRKALLSKLEISNIYEYNLANRADPLQRIVVAFDEVAELLDKTGLDKTQKEDIAKVEQDLAIIARLGRAFGINLILSTQRPDANILNGQIRNNIDGRFCGRADDVLSKIILDNTMASDQIPKTEQGLFIAQDGTVFRGYYFNEKYYS